jgi:tritrans,polycis-undecaprenyl-diphosphate synthase [geranylgeranyl-diphosphate specific]
MGLHIGIIPDGNRRYAKEHGKTLSEQYQDSYQKVNEILHNWSDQDDLGITTISFYVCSLDNLIKRPQNELEIIYEMLGKLVGDYLEKVEINKDLKIDVIGDLKLLPKNIERGLNQIRRKTKQNTKYLLRLGIGYDGKEDIAKAFRKLFRKGLPLTVENISIEMGSDIDLVIRTGKEKRLSGFFPWQTIYSEWFFLDIYFPELTKDILKKVLEDFYERQRRFGS